MNKKNLYIMIACLVAVLMVCVVIVGLINGVWPWDQTGDPADGYTGIQGGQTEDSTEEDTTAGVDQTEGTGEAPSKPSGSKPTKPEEPTYGLIIDDEEETTESTTEGTTGSTENPTEGTTEGTTNPSRPSNEINFDDLKDAANNG